VQAFKVFVAYPADPIIILLQALQCDWRSTATAVQRPYFCIDDPYNPAGADS